MFTFRLVYHLQDDCLETAMGTRMIFLLGGGSESGERESPSGTKGRSPGIGVWMTGVP